VNRRRFLNKLRELQGDVPLEVFARKLGIDPSYLSRLYRGERSPGLRAVQGALRAFPQVKLSEWGLRSPDDR
jgi:transcriptional regulator with XRE-family HTH domain